MKNLTLVILLIALSSCNQKFNKKLWDERVDIQSYPNRKNIIDDLVENHKLKGLTYKQIIDSLGTPDGMVNDTLYYDVELDYGRDIDPVYGKNLLIYLNTDCQVTDFKVKEWKHN
jgi:hypothetical protein